MYKDELTNVSVMRTDNGCDCRLSYYIRVFNSNEDTANDRAYALRVDMHNPDGRLMETEHTPPLTDEREIIKRMAGAFAAGQVPPCVLIEMCDEWIDDI